MQTRTKQPRSFSLMRRGDFYKVVGADQETTFRLAAGYFRFAALECLALGCKRLGAQVDAQNGPRLTVSPQDVPAAQDGGQG